MTASKITWQRVAGEALLIVASVFVAIALESMWQERQQAAEARAALAQMLDELKQDQTDLRYAIRRQAEIDGTYTKVRGWLADVGTVPAQEFQGAIDNLAFDNATLFVRTSAWTTMVESGYLPLLRDELLISRMADLYENQGVRLAWNNDSYDRELWKVVRDTSTRVWDFENQRFLSADPEALQTLRGQIRYLHLIWNRWYQEFLKRYGETQATLISEIEAYLRRYGYEV